MDEQIPKSDFNKPTKPGRLKAIAAIVWCIVCMILGVYVAERFTLFNGSFFPSVPVNLKIAIAGFILIVILLLTVYSIFLAAKRILTKKSIRGLPQMLCFAIAFWPAFFVVFWGDLGAGSTIIKRHNVDIQGTTVSIIQIRHCTIDAGGENHSCKNILFMKKIHKAFYKLISIIPEGKSMSIKNNLLYFHQEGCCMSPDLITVIDVDGRIRQLCDFESRIGRWGKPLSKNDWKHLYYCAPGVPGEPFFILRDNPYK